jgi:hypothetical protein
LYDEELSRLDKIPKIVATKGLRSIRADLYADDLFVLCRYGLGFKDVSWSTHGPIIEILEAPSNRKLIVVPRGTLKSTIACVGYPIWRLLRNPNERILIDSEIYTNSKNFIREIKGHLESPSLTSLYGTFKTNNWNEGEITIQQREKIFKESSITAGGIGTTKVGQHYTVICGDDYNSNHNSMTVEGRKKVIDHFRYNISILEPGGTYIITATRYAEDDIPGFILSELLGQKDIKYGVTLSDITHEQIMSKGGESILLKKFV